MALKNKSEIYEKIAMCDGKILNMLKIKNIEPQGIDRIKTLKEKPEFLSIPNNSSSFNISISLKISGLKNIN